MTSDLYAYELKDNMVELTFDYSPIEKKLFNLSEDEILEIAEKIKRKRQNEKFADWKKVRRKK